MCQQRPGAPVFMRGRAWLCPAVRAWGLTHESLGRPSPCLLCAASGASPSRCVHTSMGRRGGGGEGGAGASESQVPPAHGSASTLFLGLHVDSLSASHAFLGLNVA